MANEKQTDGGTVLRGADGQLYFIRDEMLDALKIEGEGLDRIGRVLRDAGKKPAGEEAEAKGKGKQGVEQLHYVRGDLLVDQPTDKVKPPIDEVKSTIMCPWFC
ncbi:hypothetical protein [Actinoplanes aureus]|uniref:Uncharacterized protein n=1 Tax=Actinoplanes aureus TaxID=2792083 RepID=A0A931C9R9_9ACTN|nr:hypothetical protein [Actinoplanes aureus]MBG0566015.1 hypothetical protein [Actinoplanes aureus]